MDKFKKTSDGKKGGLFIGKKHSEGGIPAIVVDTGQPIEVETGEAIINSKATALHWKELSKINQSTGGVPIPEPSEADKLFNKFEQGGKLTNNDKKIIYQKWKSLVNMSYSELLKYYNSNEGKESGLTKTEADKQGISSGRESAEWILKMKKTNYKNWTDTMWRWAKKQISFISRMRGNQGELYDDKGRKTRKLMSLLIWGHNPNKYKPGGTISQTPAPKKDRISGSSINKAGSSANINSAKSIQFSEDLTETLKNKVKDHNEKHPDKKISLSVAKAVVRRGMGAYSSSHRPTISAGKPNSRTAWGLARLNAFLYKIINGVSKSGKYSQDNDLIENLGYTYKKFDDGGSVGKIKMENTNKNMKTKYKDGGSLEMGDTVEIINSSFFPEEIGKIGIIVNIFGGNTLVNKLYTVDTFGSKNVYSATEIKKIENKAQRFERLSAQAPKDEDEIIISDSKNNKQPAFSKEAKKIVPKHQLKFLESINYSEQEDATENVNNAVFSIPKLYGQDGVKDKTIYLHYFFGNQDWYITEYDRNSGEFFGYVNLGYGAEMGYISVQELINNQKIELDFYFKPTLWSNIDNDKESSFDKQNNSQPNKEEVIDFYFFNDNLPNDFVTTQSLKNGQKLLDELNDYSYKINPRPISNHINEFEISTDIFDMYFLDNTTEFKFGISRINLKWRKKINLDIIRSFLGGIDPIPTTISGKLRPMHDIAKDIIDLVSDIERAIKQFLNESKNEISFDISSYPNPYELNKAIKHYLDENVVKFENAKNVSFTPEQKAFIKNFSGDGGLGKYGEISVGSLFEFFTPKKVIEKMWALAYKYGYSANGSVLETSVGTGEFLQFANPLSRVVAYEVNPYSAMITQILYPFCNVNLAPFESVFIKDNNTVGNKISNLEKFDLVIGNPPYGDLSILDPKASRLLLGYGEQKFTKAQSYVEYFLRRGIDLLNTGGLLIMIVGAEVRNGGKLFLDSGNSPVKEYLSENCEFLDAYRLPDKTFERTGVTSDIIVLRKK